MKEGSKFSFRHVSMKTTPYERFITFFAHFFAFLVRLLTSVGRRLSKEPKFSRPVSSTRADIFRA